MPVSDIDSEFISEVGTFKILCYKNFEAIFKGLVRLNTGDTAYPPLCPIIGDQMSFSAPK